MVDRRRGARSTHVLVDAEARLGEVADDRDDPVGAPAAGSASRSRASEPSRTRTKISPSRWSSELLDEVSADEARWRR